MRRINDGIQFQSTLPREERRTDGNRSTHNHDFNPRSHERSDLGLEIFNSDGSIFQSTLPREERPLQERFNFISHAISIHAPTRGATEAGRPKMLSNHISIHAPTRGATRPSRTTGRSLYYFNPRSHERSDNCARLVISGANVFQSTLPREERPRSSPGTCSSIGISIHAPTRGATQPWTTLRRSSTFQSTLPREERQQYCTKNLFIFIQYRQ